MDIIGPHVSPLLHIRASHCRPGGRSSQCLRKRRRRIWFPGYTILPWEGWHSTECTEYITRLLVSSDNPTGTITNSDLNISGGINWNRHRGHGGLANSNLKHNCWTHIMSTCPGKDCRNPEDRQQMDSVCCNNILGSERTCTQQSGWYLLVKQM